MTELTPNAGHFRDALEDDDIGLVYYAADETWRVYCRICNARSREGIATQEQALLEFDRHASEFHGSTPEVTNPRSIWHGELMRVIDQDNQRANVAHVTTGTRIVLPLLHLRVIR